MSKEDRFTIDELLQMTGVTRRTVRFYVQRGLIPPPAARGPGRHYGKEHIAGIQRIQELKRAGKKLDDVKAEERNSRDSGGNQTSPEEKTRRQVSRILLAKEGVWLEVARGVGVLTEARIDRLAEHCRRELGLDAGSGLRPRLLVRSLRGAVIIPNALEDGKSLVVDAGQEVEIPEVTPALRKAEKQGLISVVVT